VPALTLTGMHRKFLAAKVDKAALQAAIAFAIKSMAPGETESAGDDGTLWQTVRLPSRQGLGILFPDGYEPVQFKTDGDSQDVDPFNRIICGLYAGCFSMPLGRAMGEYGGSGYAQIRAGLIPYEKALCADRRQVWEPLWLDPLYEDFMVEFRLMAPMQELLATLSIEDRRSLDLHNIQWNWGFGDLVVDPSRERSAQEKKLRLGLSTREAELEAPDIDAHDRRAAVQLGIVDDTGSPDIMRYRRIVAQSIHGVPVEEAGNHRAGSPAPDDEGDKPDTARLQANCGTGKGGFQSGNTCARKHGGSGGDSSRGKRIAKALAISVGIALARTVVRRVEIAVAQRLVNLLMKAADRAIGVDLQAEASVGDPLLREVYELIKDRQLSRRIVRQVRRRRRKRISAESPPTEDPEPARIEANLRNMENGAPIPRDRR